MAPHANLEFIEVVWRLKEVSGGGVQVHMIVVSK
jgi:hypothetical protein